MGHPEFVLKCTLGVCLNLIDLLHKKHIYHLNQGLTDLRLQYMEF